MKCYYFIIGPINLNYYMCVLWPIMFCYFWTSLSSRASICKYFGHTDPVSMLSKCVLYIGRYDTIYAYWQVIIQFAKLK